MTSIHREHTKDFMNKKLYITGYISPYKSAAANSFGEKFRVSKGCKLNSFTLREILVTWGKAEILKWFPLSRKGHGTLVKKLIFFKCTLNVNEGKLFPVVTRGNRFNITTKNPQRINIAIWTILLEIFDFTQHIAVVSKC